MEQKKDRKSLLVTMIVLIVLAIVIFLLVLLCRNSIFSKIANAMMSVIIGVVIAYILSPACNFFEKKLDFTSKYPKKAAKLSQGLSILIVVLIALGVVALFLGLVIPALVRSIGYLIQIFPDQIQSFSDFISSRTGEGKVIINFINDLKDSLFAALPEWINNTLLADLRSIINAVVSGVTGIVKFLFNVLVGVAVAVYALSNRKNFSRQWKKIIRSIFPRKWAEPILEECHYANVTFIRFICGRALESLIVGVLCFVLMKILRLPFATLISVIIGVTNIIPFFGPLIGAIPSVLLILVIKPIQALIFLILIIVLQQFDGNVLGPKVLGNVTGLHGFWVLFSIMLFGGLFGFVGMLIGVPLFAVIYDIVRKIVNKGVEIRQKQDTESAQAAENEEEEK